MFGSSKLEGFDGERLDGEKFDEERLDSVALLKSRLRKFY